jgi:hypothetical protein
MATQDEELIRDAIISTEKEIWAEAWGKEGEGVHDDTGNADIFIDAAGIPRDFLGRFIKGFSGNPHRSRERLTIQLMADDVPGEIWLNAPKNKRRYVERERRKMQ